MSTEEAPLTVDRLDRVGVILGQSKFGGVAPPPRPHQRVGHVGVVQTKGVADLMGNRVEEAHPCKRKGSEDLQIVSTNLDLREHGRV